MKQLVSTIAVFCTLFISTVAIAQPNQVAFTTAGVITTTYAPGQAYTFLHVAPGINAKVTILSYEGTGTLDDIDDNNLTMPAAFAPRIKVAANSFGAVNFKIEFVDAVSGTAKNFNSLATTLMDIDGTLNLIHEEDAVDLGGNVNYQFHDANPEIALTKTGTLYSVKNFGGIEYPGVDTSATKVKFTLIANNNRNWFTYKVGVYNTSGSEVTRQKGLYVVYNAKVVPVRYTTLNANTYENGVQVNWVTEFERDNSYFEVERSFDGSSFTTVGMVLDAENVVNNSRSYRFKDNAAILKSKSIVYYRLKQVDVNGTITYSSVVAAKLKVNGSNNIQLFPNPVVNQTTITFKSDANAMSTIQIVGISGQVVKTLSVSSKAGINNIGLNDLENLAAGNYIIVVKQNAEVIGTQKMNKL